MEKLSTSDSWLKGSAFFFFNTSAEKMQKKCKLQIDTDWLKSNTNYCNTFIYITGKKCPGF